MAEWMKLWRWMERIGSFSMWVESASRLTRRHWKKFQPLDYQDWQKLSSITTLFLMNISSIVIRAFFRKSSTITAQANSIIRLTFAVPYLKKNSNSGVSIPIKWSLVVGWLTLSIVTLRYFFFFSFLRIQNLHVYSTECKSITTR